MLTTISGQKYEIRSITVADFIAEDNLLPIRLFNVKKNLNRYEILLSSTTKKESKKEVKEDKEAKDSALKLILKKGLLVIDENNKREQTEQELKTLLDTNYYICELVYINILQKSLKKLNKVQEITQSVALYIDSIAKRYGKTPAQILWGNEDYTELDAYFLNEFIFSTAIIHENEMIERQRKSNGR